METNVVILGDCLDVLREMPDNSIDSVVTDPPYGLSKEPNIEEVLTKWLAGEDYTHRGGGFMGKSWDSFVPGPSIWREVYRVLKPGGHALVFAGTRTQDLMTIALRLAGFEIRDVIEWLYFCLSEDTEILTCHGWVTYDKIEPYYKIACFNMETGKIEAHTPDAINIAPYSGDMVHLVSGETDQLVTPNHRLVIYEDGKFQFKPAEEADSREYTVYFADEEELCRVWRGILGTHEVSGGEEQVLFKRMQEEGESLLQQGKKTTGRTSRICQDQLQCMRKRNLEAKSLGEKGTKSGLLKGMQWETPDSSDFWFGSFKSLDGREEEAITGEDEGRKQSVLERRSYSTPFKGKLQGSDICPVSGRVQGDGPQRWICDGASTNYGNGNRETVETNRGCSSHKPRSARQPFGEPGIVGEQCRPQTTRSRKDGFIQTHISAASKRIVHYDGVVWCVTVPTGAFIARRNGRIFVTGNSGFPKSLDVSKAFDKRAGVERQVIGKRPNRQKPQYDMANGVANFCGGSAKNPVELITAPATDLAKKWNGWGTALKPAHEPIIVARKPLIGTVAENVERFGTGALNIDGCRIPLNGEKQPTGSGRSGDSIYSQVATSKGNGGNITPENGRFPANIVTTEQDAFWSKYCNVTPTDHQPIIMARKPLDGTVADNVERWGTGAINIDGCRIGNEERINQPAANKPGGNALMMSVKGMPQNAEARLAVGRWPANCVTTEPDAFFSKYFNVTPPELCKKASKRDRISDWRGEEIALEPKERFDLEGGEGYGIDRFNTLPTANNHPTVKPTTLMAWLVRLVTPPGGVVLDPFAGSGSTLVAAKREGFQYIGIEREAEYVEIAKARVE